MSVGISRGLYGIPAGGIREIPVFGRVPTKKKYAVKNPNGQCILRTLPAGVEVACMDGLRSPLTHVRAGRCHLWFKNASRAGATLAKAVFIVYLLCRKNDSWVFKESTDLHWDRITQTLNNPYWTI